jgi:hypothetical protein
LPLGKAIGRCQLPARALRSSSAISAPAPPLRPAGLGEGDHLGALRQPALHLGLQHRPLARATRGPCRAPRARSAGRGARPRPGSQQRSRASSRRRPCRSIWPWIDQWPRRSRVTTSGPTPGRRKLRPSSVSSSDSTSTSSDQACAARRVRRLALRGSGGGRGSCDVGAVRAAAASPGRRAANSCRARSARRRARRHARAPRVRARAAARAAGASRSGRGLQAAASVGSGGGGPHSSPRSAIDTTWPRPTTRWSSTRTSTRPARSSASASGTRRRATARPRPRGGCAPGSPPRRSAPARGAPPRAGRRWSASACRGTSPPGQQPVLVVEEQHREDLVRQARRAAAPGSPSRAAAVEHRALRAAAARVRGARSPSPPAARPAWPAPGP